MRSSWLRTLAHVPYGDDAVHLLVRVRRYECVPCSPSWSDDLDAVGAGRGMLSVPAVLWAAARVPEFDDGLGVRQAASCGVGGGRPGGARAGHAAARAGRPVLLDARDRRGRARMAVTARSATGT